MSQCGGSGPLTSVPEPAERFSDRVGDYLRYRPRYPDALIPVLEEETGLAPEWGVADVGSGTGFSAEPFLDHGNVVFAVEPNGEMRRAAEERLGDRPGFRSVAGSAEATGLEGGSVDLVAAGQAFHWFDLETTREEWIRILRPPRWVVLVWNTRRLTGSGFLEGYEALLREFGTDYHDVRHDGMEPGALETFFGGPVRRRTLPHRQVLGCEGLKGRLRSTSYVPSPEHDRHRAMLTALRGLFEEHQVGARVTMEYDTEIYTGRLE